MAADSSAVSDSCTGRGVQSRYLQQGGKNGPHPCSFWARHDDHCGIRYYSIIDYSNQKRGFEKADCDSRHHGSQESRAGIAVNSRHVYSGIHHDILPGGERNGEAAL